MSNKDWLDGFVSGLLFCGSDRPDLIERLRRDVKRHQRDDNDDGDFQAVEGPINQG